MWFLDFYKLFKNTNQNGGFDFTKAFFKGSVARPSDGSANFTKAMFFSYGSNSAASGLHCCPVCRALAHRHIVCGRVHLPDTLPRHRRPPPPPPLYDPA
jgi:hypothetical protein